MNAKTMDKVSKHMRALEVLAADLRRVEPLIAMFIEQAAHYLEKALVQDAAEKNK